MPNNRSTIVVHNKTPDEGKQTMNLQNLFDQFLGTDRNATGADNTSQGVGDTLNKISENLPGGLTDPLELQARQAVAG